MAGILETLGMATGDPKKDASLNYGLLQAGLSLLQSRGNFGSALGQAGQAGLLGSQQFQQQQHQRQLQQWQADEMKRRQAMQQLPQQFARTPSQTALAGGGGPTVQNAQAAETAKPSFDYTGYADSLAQYDPIQAMNLKAALAPPKRNLTSVAPGASLIDEATGQPVFTAPTAPEKDPEAIRALKLIYGEGSPEYAAAARKYGQKMSSHAPATQVNVNTAKPLLNTIGEGLGKQIDASLGQAKAATSAIGTANQLLTAIDSGKVVGGPGAKFRIFGLQVGQMLGVSGKNANEVLSNTRMAIQSMAQAELDAAQQMKGQGQITEAERDIIKRAASGDVESLTPGEMRLLALAMDKTARSKIAVHRRNLDGLRKMPGAEPLLPFYQVDEPPAYGGTPSQPRVRVYNPQTGGFDDAPAR